MKLLAIVDDRYGRRKRWHELMLYRLAAGSYILQENYVARWHEGEIRDCSATICKDEWDVIRALEACSLSSLVEKLLEQAVQTDAAFFIAVVQPPASSASAGDNRRQPPARAGRRRWSC